MAARIPIRRRIVVATGPRRRRAVTLVETIAAIGLLTFAMAIMTQLIFRGVTESRTSARRVQAAMLAQELIESFLAHRADTDAWEKAVARDYAKDPHDVPNSYLFPADRSLEAFRWSYLIDKAGVAGMKSVKVTVFWDCPYGALGWQPYSVSTLIASAVPGKTQEARP